MHHAQRIKSERERERDSNNYNYRGLCKRVCVCVRVQSKCNCCFIFCRRLSFKQLSVVGCAPDLKYHREGPAQ